MTTRDPGAAASLQRVASDPFSVQRQGPPLLGLRRDDKGRGTNLLPCNNVLWGKGFTGTIAGQRKTLRVWTGKGENVICSSGERTKAASVYPGKQTFPPHPALRTAEGEAPSSPGNPSSLAGQRQAQDED